MSHFILDSSQNQLEIMNIQIECQLTLNEYTEQIKEMRQLFLTHLFKLELLIEG